MRRDLLILLVVLASVLGTTIAYVTYMRWHVLDVRTTAVEFQVTAGQNIGFNAGTDKIYFGTVTRGGGGKREIVLLSKVPAAAYIVPGPELNGWVLLSENPVLLEPDVLTKVGVVLAVPPDATPGNYTGTITTTYVRR